MTLNIANAESAYLLGSTRFMEWQAGFEARWYAPLTMTLVGVGMASMDAPALEMLRAMNPDGFNQVRKLIGKEEV